MSKIWYITGTSRGFGRTWAEAALERGDKVAAGARDTDSLTDLVKRFGDDVLPVSLDVTDRAVSTSALSARRTITSVVSTSSSTTPASATSAWSRR